MNTDELFNDPFIFYLCMEDSVADGILNLLASHYENKQEAGKGWRESSQQGFRMGGAMFLQGCPSM